MPRIPKKSFHLGLIAALLGQVTLSGGCGESGAPTASNLPAPKNQLEGLNRIREANIKHDQTAPPKQRTGTR